MAKIINERTEYGKHYWNDEGRFNREFSNLTDRLMPSYGRGESLMAEVVRAANRLYYEYCNNGNCNVMEYSEGDEVERECPYCSGEGYLDDEQEDICPECDGMGVIYEEGEGEWKFDQYWDNFIKLIRETLAGSELENLPEGFQAEAEILMDDIRNFIECNAGENRGNYFSDKNVHRYDQMIDLVYIWCVANEGREKEEIPTWYTNK